MAAALFLLDAWRATRALAAAEQSVFEPVRIFLRVFGPAGPCPGLEPVGPAARHQRGMPNRGAGRGSVFAEYLGAVRSRTSAACWSTAGRPSQAVKVRCRARSDFSGFRFRSADIGMSGIPTRTRGPM